MSQFSRAVLGSVQTDRGSFCPSLSQEPWLGHRATLTQPRGSCSGLALLLLARGRGRVSSHLAAPVCADRVKDGGGRRNRSRAPGAPPHPPCAGSRSAPSRACWAGSASGKETHGEAPEPAASTLPAGTQQELRLLQSFCRQPIHPFLPEMSIQK